MGLKKKRFYPIVSTYFLGPENMKTRGKYGRESENKGSTTIKYTPWVTRNQVSNMSMKKRVCTPIIIGTKLAKTIVKLWPNSCAKWSFE